MKGLCNVSVAPVRADKSDRAEMVTQILYGESADILEVQKNWTLIRMDYDGYQGWMDTKQISPVEQAAFQARKTSLIKAPYILYPDHGAEFLLSIGSEIPSDQDAEPRKNEIRAALKKTALSFLGVPYLWGGRSFFGIDCSGFTQIVNKVHGIRIPRDSSKQAEAGSLVGFVEEAQPGDLAFFGNEEGRIIHVGMILDGQRIIHAHGRVRIDTLDSTGIFNAEENRYTHMLRVIKCFC